ncbi:hypothetical protein EUGRSUZ_G01697 [Eucalyptus grandis]|uniref:Uncharacterized protein n=4 Tax=Eucalyptus grandis TaxID=71139 RepID=A0ACC3K3C0_EUCGR|nr:hypothetical protein EUGRSUZ_G01697 [Eucalyptus grandis]
MASHACLAKMLAKTHLRLLSPPAGAPIVAPPVPSPIPRPSRRRPPNFSFSACPQLRPSPLMASSSAAAAEPSSGDRALAVEPGPEEDELGRLAEVAGRAADAAGEVIRKYFRKKFEILDKEDLSPVTIADQAAEEAMVAIILGSFPAHAIYGEEKGWRCKERSADYVWVLDPIDGTKSFITGKPLFGTLIALLHKGKPILGIIDQPVLKERWVGITGKRTTLNGEELSTHTQQVHISLRKMLKRHLLVLEVRSVYVIFFSYSVS